MAKRNGNSLLSFDELIEKIKNKSVFDEKELQERYRASKNLQVLELIYYGFFGSGNNINYVWLKENGYWSDEGQYPTEKKYSIDDFKSILSEGNVNVSNVIID